MTTPVEDNRRADRRRRIEATLAQYPYIDTDALAELLHWFRNEASALEVGLLTSDPKFQKPYQQLKAEHLDRIRGADLFWIAVEILVGGIAIVLTIWAIV